MMTICRSLRVFKLIAVSQVAATEKESLLQRREKIIFKFSSNLPSPFR